jgi:molybdopterin converting factor small subunit
MMDAVHVKYFGRLRSSLNLKEESYKIRKGDTLKDLFLNLIPRKHKEIKNWKEEFFRVSKDKIVFNKDGTPILNNYIILIRGKTPNLNYELKKGDEIVITPPLGGGKIQKIYRDLKTGRFIKKPF